MVRGGRWKRRIAFTILGLFLILLCGGWVYWLLPVWGMPFNFTRNGPVPLTPAWALECWLWEDDVRVSKQMQEEIARCLRRFMRFLNAKEMVIDGEASAQLGFDVQA